VKLKLPALNDATRQRLADSLGLSREGADRLVLSQTVRNRFLSISMRPKRRSLRFWAVFEQLIHGTVTDLAGEAAGPRARVVAAELSKFADKGLRPFAEAYYHLSETARDHIRGLRPQFEFEYTLEVLCRGVPIMAEELPEEAPNFLGLLDDFLHDIVILVEAVGARPALPPKSDYLCARQYPTFVVARAAVEIAHELAKQHAQSAAPELRRLCTLADATFVDHLHRAMHSL
jgi:hypothetical protein